MNLKYFLKESFDLLFLEITGSRILHDSSFLFLIFQGYRVCLGRVCAAAPPNHIHTVRKLTFLPLSMSCFPAPLSSSPPPQFGGGIIRRPETMQALTEMHNRKATYELGTYSTNGTIIKFLHGTWITGFIPNELQETDTKYRKPFQHPLLHSACMLCSFNNYINYTTWHIYLRKLKDWRITPALSFQEK